MLWVSSREEKNNLTKIAMFVHGKRSRMPCLYTPSTNQIRHALTYPIHTIPFGREPYTASAPLLYSAPRAREGAEEHIDEAKTRKKKVRLSVCVHFPYHIDNPALKLSFLEKRLYFYCSPLFSFPLHAFASVFSVLFTVRV